MRVKERAIKPSPPNSKKGTSFPYVKNRATAVKN